VWFEGSASPSPPIHPSASSGNLVATQAFTQKQLCNRYEGCFENGLRSGTGTFYYANGSTYVGEWVNNVKSGYGVVTYHDGSVFEGQFELDRMVCVRVCGFGSVSRKPG
jgi:hypothetical protein